MRARARARVKMLWEREGVHESEYSAAHWVGPVARHCPLRSWDCEGEGENKLSGGVHRWCGAGVAAGERSKRCWQVAVFVYAVHTVYLNRVQMRACEKAIARTIRAWGGGCTDGVERA